MQLRGGAGRAAPCALSTQAEKTGLASPCPSTCCVTQKKLLYFFEPQFPLP